MDIQFSIKKNASQSGFSIVELVITISIIVLVTGLSLARFSTFDNTVLLQSQAFEIAFDIRQAQQSGISVRATEADKRSAFGIYFDESTRSQYIFFQDINNDEAYDVGEELQTFIIDTRFEITNIEILRSPPIEPSSASVTFKRPNFDGRISPSGGDLEITIAATRQSTNSKIIRVTQTGQITVE